MKKLKIYLVFIVLIITSSCSNNSKEGDINPLGQNLGGGNGNVIITIGIIIEQQDIDNDGNPDEVLYFTGTPNINIKLNKVTASVPAQQYTESFNFDGTTEYQANTPAKLIGYLKNVISSGQQWIFQFEGTVANNNQTFSITSNYTIP